MCKCKEHRLHRPWSRPAERDGLRASSNWKLKIATDACSMQPGNVGQAELELGEDEPDRGNLMATMDRLNTVKS